MWHELMALAVVAACSQQPAQEPPLAPRAGQDPATASVPTVHETVVVTASRAQEQLISAPATLTVVGADAIARSPSPTYADLL